MVGWAVRFLGVAASWLLCLSLQALPRKGGWLCSPSRQGLLGCIQPDHWLTRGPWAVGLGPKGLFPRPCSGSAHW